ncbi:initiator tRNA phosphoribosyl transferase [Meredithblackwellia eburnea MCA 4105]
MDFAPTTGSTLLYPSAIDSFQAQRSEIRAKLRDTFNRLHSIAEDADFIDRQVRTCFPDFPVVANQRAGAWYVKPSDEQAQGTGATHAYFKSTDGHIGVHDFNLRRSNLALLPLIRERKGIILVDSTRRGKRFPDALSKTIPIWCAVLNLSRTRLLAPDSANSDVGPEGWNEDGKLWTLRSAIGRSEHDSMEKRIGEWAERLLSSSYDLSSLLLLRKPLRPIFVSPASVLSLSPASSFQSFIPVVLASASKLAAEEDGLERSAGYTYVQGSGDDHEAWSKGLTPSIFWSNSFEILSADRDEIDQVIRGILDSIEPSLDGLSLSQPSPTPTPVSSKAKEVRNTNLFFDFALPIPPSPSPLSEIDVLQLVLSVHPGSVAPTTIIYPTEPNSRGPITLKARTGKSGYPLFFSNSNLDVVVERASDLLREGGKVEIGTMKSEQQGEANDLGVAVGLILLVNNFDDSASLLPIGQAGPKVTKDLIRTRLQWFLETCPTINPSRASLNRVNEYLMAVKKRTVA